MKLTADQYYYVYFCMFEEPAMFKPLSYSSEFVSICQPLVLSTDNASFKAKTIDIKISGLLARLQRALSKMAEVHSKK